MSLGFQVTAVNPLVTIVIATYNRPETLRVAVESVVRQTFSRWQLLVIGDGCDEETGKIMTSFPDRERIHYINLGRRCGGQALPNTAGIAVANTDYMAFLNHDDLWFPDHLEIALDRLASSGGDFFVGRSAFAYDEVETVAGLYEPIFLYASPVKRSLRQGFSRGFLLFEPVSSWVIKTTLAQKVGAWQSPVTLYRVPLQDWVMRAWRSGAKLISDPRISCLKLETHWGGAGVVRSYDYGARGHQFLAGQFRAMALEDVRRKIEGSLVRGRWERFDHVLPSKRRTARRLEKILRLPLIPELYYCCGIDTYTLLSRLLGIERGTVWKDGLMKRTGESLAALPQLDDVIADVRQKLPGGFRA